MWFQPKRHFSRKRHPVDSPGLPTTCRTSGSNAWHLNHLHLIQQIDTVGLAITSDLRPRPTWNPGPIRLQHDL
ncbi:hypothetical protein HYQ45_002209 [Verticillium longisporum]|uniref:Uncharacterized protein n=1 Tax=Verticillium longisporum TaxID=100787 RepID=A0A8I3A0N3_VERLO|nr:hypothetical protein HYQ45_002209 [Verticillium longisporum]